MGWKHISGCVSMCKCGYPVRAKEVKANIFSGYLDSNRNATTNAFIYCQKGNGGHVYYGTYSNCVRGNNYTASQMGAEIFERYSG